MTADGRVPWQSSRRRNRAERSAGEIVSSPVTFQIEFRNQYRLLHEGVIIEFLEFGVENQKGEQEGDKARTGKPEPVGLVTGQHSQPGEKPVRHAKDEGDPEGLLLRIKIEE